MFPLRNVSWGIVRLGSLGKIVGDRSRTRSPPAVASIIAAVRGVELIGRRRMLQKALRKTGRALRFSEHLSAVQGQAMFRNACTMGLEGIVSKRLTSRYKSGACKSWLKVKNPAYERRAGA